MSHRCNDVCFRLKDLLRQGSKNGVWESVLRSHDLRLVIAAERCVDVEVRPIGNKKLLVLNESNNGEGGGSSASTISGPLTPPSTPAPHRSSPRKAVCLSPPPSPLRRLEVSWVDSANLFYVLEVDAVPNDLAHIEETLRYLKGPQTPMLDAEMVVGGYGIARSRDVDFDDEAGWTRVEIKRVDSDGVLVFCRDHGNSAKLAESSMIRVMPRFVADYPPQAHPCRLKNTLDERVLWSPRQSKYFTQLLRQCDYVLYCEQDLSKMRTKSSSTVKVVELFVRLSPKDVKSAAETIFFLEEMNRSPWALDLPITPTSSGGCAGIFGRLVGPF